MPDTATSLIQCRGVSYAINGTRILDTIDLAFQSRSWTGILGPSGSGKSTFLRCLNRLITVTEGAITYHNRLLESYSPAALRKKVCLIQQKPVMIQGSVKQNLTLAQQWDSAIAFSTDTLEKTLHQVGLAPSILDQDARSLSGGEQQRIALARGLLNHPEVLLLDEPTSNLDPRLAHHILDTIRRMAVEHHLTIIMVSHDHTLLKDYATRVGIMVNGKLIETGPSAILDNPHETESIRFLMKESS